MNQYRNLDDVTHMIKVSTPENTSDVYLGEGMEFRMTVKVVQETY